MFDKISHSAVYIRSHGRLLLRVAHSELAARFAGSLFGIGWAALTPLLLLMIYGSVYLVIFQIRAPGLTGPEYLALIFAGLVPFLMTSEALVTGVSSVVANKSVLSNTVFPIDLVPVKAVLISQVTMAVGIVIVILATLYLGRLTPMVVLLPLFWALHLAFLVGLLWILSLVNLIFRDLQNFIGVLVMFLMIASPIAYTPEMVPAGLKPILTFNPLAYFIVVYQDLLVFGRMPSLANIVTIVAMSLGIFYVGGWFFARAKVTLIDYA